MGRIILVLCLLISSVVSAQPGYTNINARYKWIAGGFDSSLILPRYGGVPSGLRSAWNTDGQLAVDTANNHLYVYSGGAWVRIANYSDVGSTYTFPYSVVAPGSAIQLENDTTANPANYFYGRNSAGRRGWYPQSGIVGVTPTLQQVLTAGSTLTGNNTIDASNYNLKANNIGLFDFVSKPTYYTSTSRIRAFGAFDDAVGGGIMLSSTDEEGTDSSYIHVQEQNITINSRGGNLYIPNLNYTLSTTAKKIPIIDTASGYTYWIDPALIGGGGSGITVGTTTITSGTSGRIAYNNAGVYGEKAVTGTGDVVLATSPTLVTPDLGTPSALVGTNISGTISTRWKARVGSTTSSATPTINTDNVDIYKLTAQTADITSFTTNLTGTPNDGDVLEIQITGTAARAITWGASFVSSTVTLPLTTVTTATLTVILQYYTTSSYGNNKWVCVNYY